MDLEAIIRKVKRYQHARSTLEESQMRRALGLPLYVPLTLEALDKNLKDELESLRRVSMYKLPSEAYAILAEIVSPNYLFEVDP